MPRFTNLICFKIWGEMAAFVFAREKVTAVGFVTPCGVQEQKQNFAQCFCLGTKLFANRSICKLRYYYCELPENRYQNFTFYSAGDGVCDW